MVGRIFNTIDLGIATINKSIAVAGITLGVTLAFINVVLRYLFNASLTWAGELTVYLFMWSALFGAAYGFKKGIHISVTILLTKLPPVLAKSLLIFSHLITMCYLILICYYGYYLVLLYQEFGEMSVDLNIPMWIPYLVLPLAFAGASFRAGEKVYEVSKIDADKVLKANEEEIIHDSVIKD